MKGIPILDVPEPDSSPAAGLDQLIALLEGTRGNDAPVDIITFAGHPDYLGLPPLWPRQRLILKTFYQLPLTLDEQHDLELLCSRKNKYAQAVVHPSHRPHTLVWVGGRGCTKTTIESIIAAYELYCLLRLPSPQKTYGLLPHSAIYVQNVATDEKQSLLVFNELKTVLERSPWFQKINYRPLEREVRFPRRVFAESLHSNSRSTRGRNTKLVLFDEMAFTLATAGHQGGKALYDALTGAVKSRFVSRGHDGRIVAVSSPGPATGIFHDLYRAAPEAPGTVMFQLATWEMVPGQTKDDYADEYARDEEAADAEYGAQFLRVAGAYLDPELVDASLDPSLMRRDHGERGLRYFMHLDPAIKRDRYGIAVVHKEIRDGREVYIVDHLKTFSGTRDNPVRIAEVEDYVRGLCNRFRIVKITADQFNSASTLQNLQASGLPAEETPFTERFNYEIYANLRTLIQAGQLKIYDDSGDNSPGLIAQLKHLVRHNKSRLYSVSAPDSGPVQVDDLADAVAAACYQCARSAGIVPVRAPRVVGANTMSTIAW
ncbi:MAG: hypothetical protein QME76_12485 [Bacillota bacterium]|nr:hypothetical protein [Bacillota bacterium]